MCFGKKKEDEPDVGADAKAIQKSGKRGEPTLSAKDRQDVSCRCSF